MDEMKRRERNVAHLWADKRVIRFFRHNFEKREYRKLRDVYLALCEIDSDFTEERESKEKSIRNMTKTCSTYTGMDANNVSETLQQLKEMELIDYGRKINEQGRIIGSYLIMYECPTEEQLKTLIRVNPIKGQPYNIKNEVSGSFKNSSKDEEERSSSKEEEYVPAGQSSLLDDPSDQNPIKSEQPILRRRKDALESKKVPYVSSSVGEVLEVWNGSGLRRHQNVESKIYASMVYSIKSLLRRDYFKNHLVFNGYKDRRFTVEEISKAIHNFALAALNPDYEPTGGYKEHLAKMSFPDFLYNAFAEDDNKSMFIKYFEHPPKLVRDNLPMPMDEHPEYTKCMKDFYARKVKGGMGRLNGKQERKFVLAGKRIHDFFLENKKRIIPMFVKRVEDRVELVFDAVNEFYKEKGIQPGNFCSDYTFDHILPMYLEKQAVLED